MSYDPVLIAIAINVIIAVVTIANSWALAVFNKKPNDVSESTSKREVSQTNWRRRERRGMWLSVLMFLLSVVSIVGSVILPVNDVTMQVLRTSGSIAMTVLSIVFIVVTRLLSILEANVSLIGGLTHIVSRIVTAPDDPANGAK